MNVVLIGLGGIGLGYDLSHPERVQTHARAVSAIEPDLFCAVDPNPLARKTFEANYRGQAYADCQSLPPVSRWHLVIVASPTGLHLDHLKWSYRQAPDLILLEKPLTTDLSELAEMDRLVSIGTTPVMVNLIRNYDTMSQFSFERLEKNSPVTGIVHYAKGFVHNGIHFLALLMKNFGGIDKADVLIGSRDRPCVRFTMGVATVTFLPNDDDSALNGMSLRQGGTEITWVDGGRSMLETARGESRLVANLGFDHYQASVLTQALRVMAGASDDSYALASQAQKTMIGLLRGEAD